MLPLLATLAPALLQAGTTYFASKSAQNQREKERKEAEKKAAFSHLVGSMGGRDRGRQAVAAPAPANPLLSAAQGLSADPLVQKQIQNLVSSFMNRLPGGQGTPPPSVAQLNLSGMIPPTIKGFR